VTPQRHAVVLRPAARTVPGWPPGKPSAASKIVHVARRGLPGTRRARSSNSALKVRIRPSDSSDSPLQRCAVTRPRCRNSPTPLRCGCGSRRQRRLEIVGDVVQKTSFQGRSSAPSMRSSMALRVFPRGDRVRRRCGRTGKASGRGPPAMIRWAGAGHGVDPLQTRRPCDKNNCRRRCRAPITTRIDHLRRLGDDAEQPPPSPRESRPIRSRKPLGSSATRTRRTVIGHCRSRRGRR